MKPVLFHFMKIFLIVGFLYGLTTLVYDKLNGTDINFWSLFFKSSFFGVFMAFAFVTMHIIALEKIGVEEISSNDLKVRQKKSVIAAITKDELIQKLKADSYTCKMVIRNNDNDIDIKTGISFWSWGENIRIKVKPTNDRENEFLITSEPKLKATWIDFGRNLDHVNRIGQLMQNA